MPQYNPPIRDMQFLLHEVFDAVPTLQSLPAHAGVDADTLNAVLVEGGKFASEVLTPLNLPADAEGCHLDKATHAVTAPKGFKQAYAQYVDGGWPALSLRRPARTRATARSRSTRRRRGTRPPPAAPGGGCWIAAPPA